MSPDIELVHYDRGKPTEAWAVRVMRRGPTYSDPHFAWCPTAQAAIAAMRLFGGDDALHAWRHYLLDIGCTRGHDSLDAINEALRI